MKAVDVMVPDVVTVKPGDQVAEAVRLLAQHDVSALPDQIDLIGQGRRPVNNEPQNYFHAPPLEAIVAR